MALGTLLTVAATAAATAGGKALGKKIVGGGRSSQPATSTAQPFAPTAAPTALETDIGLRATTEDKIRAPQLEGEVRVAESVGAEAFKTPDQLLENINNMFENAERDFGEF